MKITNELKPCQNNFFNNKILEEETLTFSCSKHPAAIKIFVPDDEVDFLDTDEFKNNVIKGILKGCRKLNCPYLT